MKSRPGSLTPFLSTATAGAATITRRFAVRGHPIRLAAPQTAVLPNVELVVALGDFLDDPELATAATADESLSDSVLRPLRLHREESFVEHPGLLVWVVRFEVRRDVHVERVEQRDKLLSRRPIVPPHRHVVRPLPYLVGGFAPELPVERGA